MNVEQFNLVKYCEAKFDKQRNVGSRLFISCPFHEDDTPSMLVEEDHVHCFSCGAHLMSGQFYKEIEGDEIYVPSIRVEKKEKKEYRPCITDSYLQVMSNTLIRTRSALSYLENRGISKRTIRERKIGYGRPKIKGMKFPRYAFPAFNKDGDLVNVSYRKDPRYNNASNTLESQKYVLLPGSSSSIYGIEYLDRYDAFVYAGGQIDCLTLFQLGIPSLGALGEASFKEEWATLLSEKEIFIMLDNDKAGILSAKRMKDMMPWSVVVEWLPGTEGMDVNDVFLDKKYGPSAIRKMIENVGGSVKRLTRKRH